MVAFSLAAPAAAQTGATSQRATLSSSLKRPSKAAAGPARAASQTVPRKAAPCKPSLKESSHMPLPPVKGLSKPSLKRSSNTMQVVPTAQAASKKVGSKAKKAARPHKVVPSLQRSSNTVNVDPLRAASKKVVGSQPKAVRPQQVMPSLQRSSNAVQVDPMRAASKKANFQSKRTNLKTKFVKEARRHKRMADRSALECLLKGHCFRKLTHDKRGLKPAKVVTLATEFSGMAGAYLALNDLVPCEHVIASETDSACCRFLKAVAPNLVLHGAAEERTDEDVKKFAAADLVVSTSPCRDYSRAGKEKGMSVARGKLQLEVQRVMGCRTAKAIIIEQTFGITCKKHKGVLKMLADVASKNNYSTRFFKIESNNYGTCQMRKRLYGIFVNNKFKKHAICEPPKFLKTQTLQDILAPRVPVPKPCVLPAKSEQKSLKRQRAIIMNALGKVYKKNGVDPRTMPVAVDIDASEKFATLGVNEVPTLLHARSRGMWVSTLSARLDLREVATCQGFSPDDLSPMLEANVSERQMISMLGDAVTKSAMKAVMAEVLYSIGILPQRAKPGQLE